MRLRLPFLLLWALQITLSFALCPWLLGQETSVKPGINERWKSPKIEPLIDTLEAESREIYAARDQLAGLVGLKAGSVIADVGSGSGFMTLEFAQRVGSNGKVYAVDINPELLKHVLSQTHQAGYQNVETVVTAEDSVDLPADSVDYVFLCDTYHHFEYPQKSLASLYKALRPGGEVVLVEFKRVPGESQDWVLEHVRAGKEVFKQEFLAAGFEFASEQDTPFLEENYVLRFRK